jgi:NitT/TauT family transport system permease protein
MSRAGWIRAAIVTAGLLLLELVCRSGLIPPVTLTPPSQIALTLVEMLSSGQLTSDALQTLSNVLAASVSAVGCGFTLGAVLHSLPRARRAVDPFLASYYSVPVFVFYPILIALFGMRDLPIIVIGFISAVVAMIINTLNGLDRVPRALLKTARIYHMNAISTAVRIKLPSAAPHVFTGIKLAVAYSFIGVIAAEFILSGSGLGYAISFAYNDFQTRKMYALMLFIIVLVITVNAAFHLWEQSLLKRRAR